MGQIHIVFELLFGRRHLLISLGVDLNKKKEKNLRICSDAFNSLPCTKFRNVFIVQHILTCGETVSFLL